MEPIPTITWTNRSMVAIPTPGIAESVYPVCRRTRINLSRKYEMMKAFFLIAVLIFVGCAGSGQDTKPKTNPAADVQWKIMLHYSQKFVCSNLSDEAYFNMLWENIEGDMVAVAERKREPGENIRLYKHELREDVIKNRATYRERYGCPP